MIAPATLLLLLALATVPLAWAVPQRHALDAIAAYTALLLAALAPASALWLLAAAILTPLMLQLGERSRQRDLTAGLAALLLLAAFVAARLTPGILWVGGAFFTLRALHVVGDWWLGHLPAPRLRAHLRYQLFLPVIVAGPIHRLPHFTRQAERRRFESAAFFAGLERALFGAVSAYVIGGYLVSRIAGPLSAATSSWPAFSAEWASSVLEWIGLYFTFAGFTAVALGISLMIGLRLEENFDRPWAARSLTQFWTRWHMTLTGWCRDYVFRPVAAITRSPLAGLVLALLAIGLWHEFSLYYLLWSFWQALGVVLTRLAAARLPLARLPERVRAVLGPLTVLGWLSLARPVIHLAMGVTA